MKVRRLDLGLTDYAACWALQRTLFDELLSRKAARTDRQAGGSAPQTADRTATMQPDSRAAGAEGRIQAASQADRKPAEVDAEAGRTLTEPASAAGRTPSEAGKTRAEDNADHAGYVLLTEHRPVYTLGKSGHAENLLVTREALEAAGAQFFHIDRGGDITFHGPGQLVCYPILDLERLGLGLREYIAALEETVIRTAACFGIRAGRIAGASGVWIDPEGVRPRKLCAIGVRSSRFVTMHGFALNVRTDLRWFARINPCGFTDRGVASIASETGPEPDMERVKALVMENLSEILNVKIYNN